MLQQNPIIISVSTLIHIANKCKHLHINVNNIKLHILYSLIDHVQKNGRKAAAFLKDDGGAPVLCDE